MTDFNQALDLRMLRKDHDLAAGFQVSNGLYQMQVDTGEGKPVQVVVPVLDIMFHMANNKTSYRISVTPDTIIPLIAVLAEWRVKLDQQVATPPVPPGAPT